MRTLDPFQKAALAALVLLNGFFLLFETLARRLNGSGIDDSVFYHLFHMGEGAAYSEFRQEMLIFAAGAGAVIFSAFLIFRVIRSRKWRWIAMAALAALLPFNPGLTKTLQHAAYREDSNDALDQASFIKNGSLTARSPRNLVYIYLESLENTYTNEDVFPGLTPRINRLKQEAFVLENAWMPSGTSWTIAGMVGSQCGLPLVMDSDKSGNGLQKMKDFLRNANCMGDHLAKAGYTNHYMGGADIRFGGKLGFYGSHGFRHIQGLNELENAHETGEKSSWGIYDDALFDILGRELPGMRQQSPYALFVLNLDTHHPVGHVSPHCRDVRYRDGEIKILNAVHCTDALVGDFVDRVRKTDPGAVIVISSDHLAMPNDAADILEKNTRRNLFLVLGDGIAPRRETAATSTFDFGPTVMGFMGFGIQGLGWGRNLREQPSLMAGFSENEALFDQAIASHRHFHASFWGNETFQGLNPVAGQVDRFSIAGQEVDAPFAIRLDQDKKHFSLLLSDEPIMEIGTHANRGDNVIYVDKCGSFEASGIAPNENGADDVCYLISPSGRRYDLYGKVEPDLRIDKSLKPSGNTRRIKTIFSRLDKVMYFGAKMEKLRTFQEKGHDSFVDVSGGIEHLSTIRWRGKDIFLRRGLTFFGQNADGSLTQIAFKDFCDAATGPDVPEELAKALSGSGGHERVFYVAADSPYCEKEAFDAFAANLPMPLALASLKFREPMFAMVSKGRETSSKGGAGGRVVVK